MQQSTAPAPTGLENSTYLVGFTCALGCRAIENFDISSDFFSIYIYIYIYIYMQILCGEGQVLFYDISRPALTNKALFSHFCLLPWSVKVLI